MNEKNVNGITKEDLENYQDHGMRCKEVFKYQEEFKKQFGRDLDPENDMIEVGEYGEIIYDEDGNWTKFMLIGDDIGNGEFYFFIWKSGVYLDKGNMMLDEEYHEMFKTTLGQFFGGSVTNTIDFRGLRK